MSKVLNLGKSDSPVPIDSPSVAHLRHLLKAVSKGDPENEAVTLEDTKVKPLTDLASLQFRADLYPRPQCEMDRATVRDRQ